MGSKSVPLWLCVFLLAAGAALIWGFRGSYEKFWLKEQEHDPFLEVTNRDFSLFLWQFPSFLRVNVSAKMGYLPGFSSTSENLNAALSEEFVSVPPDLLFLYHTWHRLLAPEFTATPIAAVEFEDFLRQLPEWQPSNWKQAPGGYVDLIESHSYSVLENLQTLPEVSLPMAVRRAFQGWKNYFLEGKKINAVNPTLVQVATFLEHQPHYARNFWRNIGVIHGQRVAGLDYLLGLSDATSSSDAHFAEGQLAPFLKVALFNAESAQ